MNTFNIDLSWYGFLLFAVAGVFTGIINTIAGSGSLITLPIFMVLCQLPPSVANATNRIGVLFQSVVASAQFAREDPELYKHKWNILLPSIAGAIIGSKIAIDITEYAMNICLLSLMIFMLFMLIFKPERWLLHEKKQSSSPPIVRYIIYFMIGLYGGFIQAGVGFFILAGLVLVSRFTLSQANGLKLLIILAFTLPALVIFIVSGKVHYAYGLLMGFFQAIGSWIGVRFITRLPNANLWIYRILIVIVALSAIYFIAKMVSYPVG